MANENNTNRQNNHQPSMRELANERMRKMREERAGAAGSRRVGRLHEAGGEGRDGGLFGGE